MKLLLISMLDGWLSMAAVTSPFWGPLLYNYTESKWTMAFWVAILLGSNMVSYMRGGMTQKSVQEATSAAALQAFLKDK